MPVHLIIGRDYLGQRLHARLAASAQPVYFTTRSASASQEASGVRGRHVHFDLDERQSWYKLDKVPDDDLLVYFLLPPGQIDIHSLQEFVEYLNTRSIQRLAICSSTVVYPRDDIEVDADSMVMDDTPRALRQLAVENVFSASNNDWRIVRLAGLYGPGRIIGRKMLAAGEAPGGNPEAWLNLVHVEDAAELLIRVARGAGAGKIELGCDGTPVKRAEYYRDLALSLGLPPPRFTVDTTREKPGRRCSNTPTCRRCGWQPVFTDYRKGWLAVQRMQDSVPGRQ